ncbi:hypothetical protein C8R47DRAFT_1071900 [Mycena vitilis]|nr:hypothetical protein C8R47DRAFT_1071900 [Mycena vitilis]
MIRLENQRMNDDPRRLRVKFRSTNRCRRYFRRLRGRCDDGKTLYQNVKTLDPFLIPLDNFLGAWLVGVIVSGVSLDAFHLALASHAFYFTTVTHFGDYVQLGIAPWSLMVQLFYAFRIYTISNKRLVVPIIITICACAELGLGTTFMVKGFHIKAYKNTASQLPFPTSSLSLQVACDVVIAAAMLHYLLKNKSEFQSSEQTARDRRPTSRLTFGQASVGSSPSREGRLTQIFATHFGADRSGPSPDLSLPFVRALVGSSPSHEEDQALVGLSPSQRAEKDAALKKLGIRKDHGKENESVWSLDDLAAPALCHKTLDNGSCASSGGVFRTSLRGEKLSRRKWHDFLEH